MSYVIRDQQTFGEFIVASHQVESRFTSNVSHVLLQLRNMEISCLRRHSGILEVDDGYCENVVFRDCSFGYLRFRHGSYTNVLFENCKIRCMDMGSGLAGATVTFRDCIFQLDQVHSFCNPVDARTGIKLERCEFFGNSQFQGGGFKVSSCRTGYRCQLNLVHNSRFLNFKGSFLEMSGVRNLLVHGAVLVNSLYAAPDSYVWESTFELIKANSLSLFGSRHKDVNFWDCTFVNKDFSGAILENVDFHNSHITEEDLAMSKSFSDVNLY